MSEFVLSLIVCFPVVLLFAFLAFVIYRFFGGKK